MLSSSQLNRALNCAGIIIQLYTEFTSSTCQFAVFHMGALYGTVCVMCIIIYTGIYCDVSLRHDQLTVMVYIDGVMPSLSLMLYGPTRFIDIMV